MMKGSYSNYNWLRPGAFAVYRLSTGAFSGLEEAGVGLYYIPSRSEGGRLGWNHVLFKNGTYLNFDNLTIFWHVLEVLQRGVLVNYTLTFYNVVKGHQIFGGQQEVGNFSLTIKVVVDDALNVYDEEGGWIGRWPFWVRGYELDSEITMVHDIWLNPLIQNITAKLMDLGTYVSRHVMFRGDVTKTFIHTPFKDFHLGRLLFLYPVFIKVSDEYDHYEASGALGVVYDKESFIMVANHQSYIDDIILHRLLQNITHYISLNDDIALSDTNVYKLAEVPEQEEFGSIKAEIIAVVISVSVIGVFLGVYYLKHVKKKGA